MRHGDYPGKRVEATPSYGQHRVVVPFYIPELSGYFRDAEVLLDLTLESLRRSTAGRAAVTLIANGCCPPIVERLQLEREKGWLDQLLINRDNRGKADAQRSALHSCFEHVVTLSDGDVLFHQGWLEAVHGVFASFPEAGSVSPVPNPKSSWSNTTATVLGGFLRRELAYRPLVERRDLEMFAHSLGYPEFFAGEHFKSQLSVARGSAVACVGHGHFLASLRREVIERVPRTATLAAMGQGSEFETVDAPPDLVGCWRLATPRAWARHLGNVAEQWMQEELETHCPELARTTLTAQLEDLPALPPMRPGVEASLPRSVRSLGSRLARRTVRP